MPRSCKLAIHTDLDVSRRIPALLVILRRWSKDEPMAKEARKQVGLTMRATLYDDLAKLAADNGQTTT